MTPTEARRTLETRSRAVADRPVLFRAGSGRWKLTARKLEISVNWRGAVSAALRQGEGPAPVRGFRRLGVRLFGADVTPAAQAYDAALQYELDQISARVNRSHRDAVAAARTPHAGRSGRQDGTDGSSVTPRRARSCRRSRRCSVRSRSICP